MVFLMRPHDVVLSVMTGVFCCSCILMCAPRPIQEYDAAESKNAVVLVGLGGLVQPGCSLSLRILKVLKTRLLPAGAPCHFPFGAFLKPVFAVLPPIVFCLVASFL